MTCFLFNHFFDYGFIFCVMIKYKNMGNGFNNWEPESFKYVLFSCTHYSAFRKLFREISHFFAKINEAKTKRNTKMKRNGREKCEIFVKLFFLFAGNPNWTPLCMSSEVRFLAHVSRTIVKRLCNKSNGSHVCSQRSMYYCVFKLTLL